MIGAISGLITSIPVDTTSKLDAVGTMIGLKMICLTI